jgi:hypothetical protein
MHRPKRAARERIAARENGLNDMCDSLPSLAAELMVERDDALSGAIRCRDNAARYRRERDEAIARAEQSDMLANTAIAELALCTDEFGIVHAVDCEDDSVCDCSERLSWLTSDMVSKARAAIRARRGGRL